MAFDNMYLENLEEYIIDENKIVTYKWLSKTLQVQVNIAKQMLYSFVQHQRNNKDNDSLSVVYFVAGLTKPVSDSQVHKCAVVKEEDLGSYKSTLSVLTSCHVYSVQSVKLKDSNSLYLVDYNEFKDNIFKSNKFSAIQCAEATLRSEDELNIARSSHNPSPGPPTKVSNGTGSTHEHKPAPKPQQKKGIAGMFATSSKKTDSSEGAKTGTAPEEKKATKTEPKSSKVAEKKGGMMAFFSKQPEKSDSSKPSPKSVSVKPDTKKPETKKPETKKPSSPSPVKAAPEKPLSPSPVKR
ncbi:hypothetical protein ScPMuIL_018291 [Solemya velum]